MRIQEIITEAEETAAADKPETSGLQGPYAARIGNAIRLWTSQAMYRLRSDQVPGHQSAAKIMSGVPGQQMPTMAYRVFGVNIDEIRSWRTFANRMKAEYPESYSGSMEGLRNFLRDCGIATPGRFGMVIAIHLSPGDGMFYIPSLAQKLPESELNKPDRDGDYTIRDYIDHDEVVARPGTLKRALLAGNAYLVGYQERQEGRKRYVWLPEMQPIVIN